jgi:hypothetical protein
MTHNSAHKGEDIFSGASVSSGFDVDDLVVDLYYEFCVFCDTTYKQVLKNVSTRWLSLEKAVSRTLEMNQPLKVFFLSGSEKQPRLK